MFPKSRFFLYFFFLLLLPALSPASSVKLDPFDAKAPWGRWLQTAAERGLAQAEARLGLKLDEPVEVYSRPDVLSFERDLGHSAAQIVAAARPDRCQIVINRPAWFRQDPDAQQQTLTHEMTHLVLGRRVPGRIPAWLNEGLAMLTAGEMGMENSWRVLVAGTFDTLIPVELLMDNMPEEPGRQDLGYAQSLALTQFYLRRQNPESRGLDPAPLIKSLADPESGARRVKMLWDPVYVASLEYQWRHSYHTIGSVVLFLSGSTFLWMAISLLFLFAWWRKKRYARGIRERFASEENWDGEYGAPPQDLPEWSEAPDEEEWRGHPRP